MKLRSIGSSSPSLALLSSPALGAFAIAVSALAPSSAHAQQSGEFSVQRFEPAPGANNYLSVERVRMTTQWGWTAGMMFNYARNPFVVVSCVAETNCSSPNATNKQNVSVVSNMFQWDFLGSLNLTQFLQVGLRLPLAYVNGEGINLTNGQPAVGGLHGFGVGDPMVEGKIRFLGKPEDLLNLGGAVDLAFPAGHASAKDKFIGDDAPIIVTWKGIADIQTHGFSASANLMGRYRGKNTLGTTTVGPVEFRYGIGAGYTISPVFKVMAEGYGSSQFAATKGTNTLEIDAGPVFTPLQSGLNITVAGGVGVLEGVGVPAGRAIFGIGWSADAGDKDNDGIPDSQDKCPTIPEDKDGFEDSDGCPDDDNDKDGIPDKTDKCPNQPETINGYKDTDGCPDEVKDSDGDGIPDMDDKCPDKAGTVRTKEFYGCADTDEDGVADPIDKCPTEKEDTDGFEDTDGCPDPDNDKDGIPDTLDECSEQPETMNGYKDEDGCPDEAPDTDHDGIPDPLDKCPTQPETYNGFQDEDGCPDKGPNLVQITDNDIKILQRVEFETGSEKIKGATSFTVLDAVVSALKNDRQIFLIEVGGHTDNAGDAASNKTLSQKRAEAVKAYLVSKGLETGRLTAVGYGQEKPIGDNKTPAGKQKNRRVEFNILSSTKKKMEAPPATIATPPESGAPAPAPAPAPAK